MKNKLIVTLTCIFVAFAFITCKKQLPVVSQPASQNQFAMRMGNLDPKQTGAACEKFKQSAKDYAIAISHAKSTGYPDTTGTITLDSAFWLIESTLNLEFDNGGDQDSVPTTFDSTYFSRTIPVTRGSISNADAAHAYNYFSDYCTAINAAGNAVKVFDLYTTVTPDGVVFKANVITLVGKPGYPFIPNCDPFTTQSALWSVTYGSGCSSNTNDAPMLVKNRLNCQNINGKGCYNGRVVYLVPQTILFSNAPSTCAYASALYCNVTNVSCDPTVLSATQMNNYVNNCITLANSNTPAWSGTFPGFTVSNYAITPAAVGGMGFVDYWWMMNVTYARPFCSYQFYQ